MCMFSVILTDFEKINEVSIIIIINRPNLHHLNHSHHRHYLYLVVDNNAKNNILCISKMPNTHNYVTMNGTCLYGIRPTGPASYTIGNHQAKRILQPWASGGGARGVNAPPRIGHLVEHFVVKILTFAPPKNFVLPPTKTSLDAHDCS